MTKMEDIKKKSDAELAELVSTARKTVQGERFKDAFSRKAEAIHTAKKDTARALTELRTRHSNNATK
ncbi:MAG: 50S ribosomal protein L29 [Patescibacteria group bacterium]